MNGSPKTSVNTAVNTVLTHPPGNTCKNPGIPEKYLGPRQCRARPTPRAPAPTAARTACSSTRTAPCALATSAKGSIGAAPGTACRWRCGRCGRADILLQAPPWAGGSTGESTRWRSGRAPSLRTPLATPRGRACQKYSPSSGIHTISHTTHESAPAVCIACCVPLHSGARRPACMQHKQTAHRCRSLRCGQSQHRPASAWACAVWLA